MNAGDFYEAQGLDARLLVMVQRRMIERQGEQGFFNPDHWG